MNSQFSILNSQFRRSALALLLLLSAAVVPAAAQDQAADPFETAKMRIGPFAATPTISLSNLGLDSNVFNSWTDPQSDFTFTVTPGADAWLRLGRGRLAIHTTVSYVHFATFSEERSLNTENNARFELPLTHFRPYFGYSYLNVRDRPGYEIDARARRSETGVFGGLALPLTRKTTIGVAYKTTKTAFAQGEQFNDVYLRDLFNRRTNVAAASLRYSLTPLTTIVLDAEIVRERFEYAPIRDNNGFRIVPGVEFGKYALINGSARVGFRTLHMLTAGMPDYTGPVASVDLGYTLMGSTRFTVGVSRDVAYSYEVFEPYYLLTGVTGSVTQHLGGPWDAQARAGVQRLAYQRAVIGAPASPEPGEDAPAQAGDTTEGRLDTVSFFGGGVGYKLGPSVRLGVNLDYYTRNSDVRQRAYEGLRFGTSVTYGF